MKKILMLIMALMTMATLSANAQNGNATEFEITKKVPAKLELKDDMVVKNATKLFLNKVTVIYQNEELGTVQYLYKGDDEKVKKYKNNELAQFRGAELTVKILCDEAAEKGVALDALFLEDDEDLIIKIIVPKNK